MALSTETLEMYYQRWRKGESGHRIQEMLGMTKSEFRRSQPEFLHYCRERAAADFREESANGCYKHMPLTAERKEEFLSHIHGGLDFSQAALVMGIPIPTLFDHWFRLNPEFKRMVDNARINQNAELRKALYKRATGYSYPTVSKTHTSGVGKDGPIDVTATTTSMKVVEPDTNALKFALINRLPDEFSEDGMQGTGANRGRILEAIDADMEVQAKEYDELTPPTEEEHPVKRLEP